MRDPQQLVSAFQWWYVGWNRLLEIIQEYVSLRRKENSLSVINPSAYWESNIFSTKVGLIKLDMLNAVCFMDGVYVV